MLRHSFPGKPAGSTKRPAKTRRHSGFPIEQLEQRVLLSAVTVNAGSLIGPVQTNLLGVNFATWDGLITSSNSGNTATPVLNTQTQQEVSAAGLNTFRIPGGGTSDFFHFFLSNGGAAVNGANSVGAMAELVASVNGVGMVTVNYGTGSPQEGAAMLAYLNGTANGATLNNVVLGTAPVYLTTSSSPLPQNSTGTSWTTYNFQTAGFWATLRSQTPAANPTNSDGLNFLRIGRTQPFGFHFFEIGNEIYGAQGGSGAFSADAHGLASFPAGSLPMPAGDLPGVGDPATYIAFAKEFSLLAAQIDPTISIGIGAQSVSANDSNNWINNILIQSVSQGFQPGFISDHIYPGGPGNEKDSTLLGVDTAPQNGVIDGPTNTVNTYDLVQRSAVYRALLSYYFPGSNVPGASNYVELLATEMNSVYSTPGKQSVSIVNGLFIADSMVNMMATESTAPGEAAGALGTTGYDGLWVWDLHNSQTAGNKATTLYGWRTYGDYGMLGVAGSATGEGADVEYPDYFAEQLGSKIIDSGGQIVSSSSSSGSMEVSAVLESDGDLELFVVNNTVAPGTPPNNLPIPGITNTFSLSGFLPSGKATIYQYGANEDDASDNKSTNYAASLTTINTTLSISANSFSYAVPDYTMMVIDLKPATAPALTRTASAAPNPAAGTSTALSVGAVSTDGSALTYTWAASGPAAVLYSGASNGSAAASVITANFAQAGSYSFTVTISDAAGLSTTSTVAVDVMQTVTAISVTPQGLTTLPAGSTQQFSASATDQFGNPISSPTFTWAITGSGNTIDSTGLATLDAPAGDYTVTASVGSVNGTDDLTTLAAAPTVTSYTINDGNAQRSMVDSITVVFSEPVTLSTGAITLSQRSTSGGSPTAENFVLSNPSDDQQTYVLTFTDPSDEGGSLPDGVYDLIVHAALVANASNETLADGDQTYSFYRLYGDFFGNGSVGIADLLVIAQDFGATVGQPRYDSYVDVNASGGIGIADLLALVQRFGQTQSVTAAAPLSGRAPIINPAAPSDSTSTPAAGAGAATDSLASPPINLNSAGPSL